MYIFVEMSTHVTIASDRPRLDEGEDKHFDEGNETYIYTHTYIYMYTFIHIYSSIYIYIYIIVFSKGFIYTFY
jgi:hypothetical protein